MAGPCVWDLAADLPEVDVIMGFEQYQNLPASIGGMLGVETRKDTGGEAAARSRVRVGSASPPFRPEALRKRLTPNHYAYLRVAEGCDHKCTFCAIPGFRGKFRSKPWDSIIEEAKAGAYTGSHLRSTRAFFAPFRSNQPYNVPYMTQIKPWMCPEGAQVEL